MKENTKEQLLKKTKVLQARIGELEDLQTKHEELRQIVIESNRMLQENTQKLFNAQLELKARAEKEKKLAAKAAAAAEKKRVVALTKSKKEIEKKNKELDRLNRELREENERIIAEQKNMTQQDETVPISQNSEMAKSKERKEMEALKGLKAEYGNLLEFYMKNDKKNTDVLIKKLCNGFIQADLPPKMIVELHITSVKKIADDIDKRAEQRTVSAVRMVLLMVMTKYANLLRQHVNKN